MDKFIEIDRSYPKTGEPTVQAVVRWTGGRSFVEKRANPNSPAFAYIQSVKPREGKTVVLVNAMGAFETYDANRNGDAFNTRPYNVGKRAPAGRPGYGDQLDGWVRDGELLQQHYQSFTTAGIYEHHQNKDIGRSLGKIEKAFWNDYMQRVELLLEIENSRQPQLIERISDGEFPAVSMGCRIKYDVCSVCGNRAPTRAEYCDHLKFQLNYMDPETGLLWCALNPSPFFFDISFVFRPADPTGFMLKKVAYELWSDTAGYRTSAKPFEGEQKLATYEEKQSAVRKIGTMQKEVIDGKIMALRGSTWEVLRHSVGDMESATDAEVNELAKAPIADAIASAEKEGCLLSSSEFSRVLAKKSGVRFTPRHLDKIALVQPAVIEAFALYPDLYTKIAELLFPKTAKVVPGLIDRVGEWAEKRSSTFRSIQRHFMEPSGIPSTFGPGYRYNATAPAKTDLLTLSDPSSGSVYQTTRGAAQEADSAHTKKLLGTAALMTAGYTLGSSLIPGLRDLPLGVRGAGSAVAGYLSADNAMNRFGPTGGSHYMTDEGVPIRATTQLTKLNSDFLGKLAFDMYERLGAWPEDGKLAAALCRKCDSSHVRSLISSGTKEKTAALFAPLQSWDGDPCSPPTLKLADAIELFGALVAS